jgi:type VI secretion system protein ImpI
MDIMLEIVSRQKHSASFRVSHVFGEAGGYIGRSEECEWVLPDRTRKISRKHALISFDDGAFYLQDLSSNGVSLTLGNEPVGKGMRHRIEHGEGFIIGDYSIMARLLHDPGTYASSSDEEHEDLLTLVHNPLSLDPLKAMDEEEERIARQRLGDFDDLLGGKHQETARLPTDHCDPRVSTLQPMVAIPESETIIPEDWDSDPDDLERPAPEQPDPPARPAADLTPPPRQPASEHIQEPELELFFKALGFTEPPASRTERERILRQAAALLHSAVQGMTRALQDRAECRNELRLPITTSLDSRNNPLKFSPTPEAAMAILLAPQQKGVLPAAMAMHQGFDDLYHHHKGLLAGARAMARATLDKVSPVAVERRLDINGPVRLRRTARLWNAFIRLHQALSEDNETSAGIFLRDFAGAYESHGQRALNPSTLRISKGDLP